MSLFGISLFSFQLHYKVTIQFDAGQVTIQLEQNSMFTQKENEHEYKMIPLFKKGIIWNEFFF